MSVFDDAQYTVGEQGPPGAATVEQVGDIEARLAARELITIPTVTTDLTNWSDTAPTEGQYAIYTGGKWTPYTLPSITVPFTIPFIVGGGSSAPSAGVKGLVRPNFPFTITGWTVNNDVSGSVEWDIRVSASSIVGSVKPSTSNAISSASTNMSGWTTSHPVNTGLEIWINSASTITLSSLNLHCTRTLDWS